MRMNCRSNRVWPGAEDLAGFYPLSAQSEADTELVSMFSWSAASTGLEWYSNSVLSTHSSRNNETEKMHDVLNNYPRGVV